MDEMTKVRELRAGAPVPDRGRLAPGRARLMDAARAGERRRTLWQRREFVIVAVVAAVTAVAVTAALLVGGDGTGRKVQPAVTPSVSLKGLSAAELLELAADALEAEPETAPPTAKQWIYTKQMNEAPNEEVVKEQGLRALEVESWIRYDGSERGFMQKDPMGKDLKLYITKGGVDEDERSPRDEYQDMAALPADGEQTLKALREKDFVKDRKSVSQARNDYDEIIHLLGTEVAPAKGLASLYRALALLPGGTVADHLVDTLAGRRAIALEYPKNEDARPGEGMRYQWLLDPQTYRIIGLRMVSGEKVLGGDSLVTLALVDKAGDRT